MVNSSSFGSRFGTVRLGHKTKYLSLAQMPPCNMLQIKIESFTGYLQRKRVHVKANQEAGTLPNHSEAYLSIRIFSYTARLDVWLIINVN